MDEMLNLLLIKLLEYAFILTPWRWKDIMRMQIIYMLDEIQDN